MTGNIPSRLAMIAAKLAVISRYYVRTLVEHSRAVAEFIGDVIRRVGKFIRDVARFVARETRQLYLKFEKALASALTDTLLVIWSIRQFVYIIAFEVALVYLAWRFPWFWIPAILFSAMLMWAAATVWRGVVAGKVSEPETDPLREPLLRAVLLLFRLSLFALSLAVSWHFVGRQYAPRAVAYVRAKIPNALTSPNDSPLAQLAKDSIATTSPTPAGYIKNGCDSVHIDLAVRSLGRDSVWRTQGWYHLAPGDSLHVKSYSPTILFYGENSDGSHTWGAEEGQYVTSFLVSDSVFSYVGSELTGPNVRPVLFVEKRLPSDEGNTTVSVLACE
jgi:hypothetical protein